MHALRFDKDNGLICSYYCEPFSFTEIRDATARKVSLEDQTGPMRFVAADFRDIDLSNVPVDMFRKTAQAGVAVKSDASTQLKIAMIAASRASMACLRMFTLWSDAVGFRSEEGMGLFLDPVEAKAWLEEGSEVRLPELAPLFLELKQECSARSGNGVSLPGKTMSAY